ncbi:hypothetical protein N7495_001591 [Penicillium taxi]|uniref:uncharacterized protein n=1 Tax=Penicillium taxi TaxID=168475 RepID=UPI002544D69F|nr:uncharacterized protein N7495_001591 [Penicillium taxi]KAJ5908909.1 hypothetical protein N7495_001591 [Penicillium taxi]
MWNAKLRPLLMRETPVRRALSTLRGRNAQLGPRGSTIRSSNLRSVKGAKKTPQPEPVDSDPQEAVPNYDPSQNTLLSPVYLPEDPNGVLKENHPAMNLLANSGLVVQRQLEMMNVMIGFEQANKYVIMDAQGNHIGYMAEQEKGVANIMARQWFRTHRSFVTHVFDRYENEVLRFNRPFSWINSRIQVYDPLDVATSTYSSSTSLQNVTPGSLVQADAASKTRVSPLSFDQMRVIGEAQQQWAPLRRKYNLFTSHQSPNLSTDMGTQMLPLAGSNLSQTQQMQLAVSNQDQTEFNQFAYVDEPFLSWDFSLQSANNRLIGSVNRNFAGFAREIFTDAGVYALRMDAAEFGTEASPNDANATGMTLDQRAVMLATAVSIDFDYFSRHSGSGGLGFMPLWFPGLSGEAAAGGAAGGAAEAGAIGEAAAGTVGRGAVGGMTDGMATGVAGAGAIAGYEAMQRGASGDQNSHSTLTEDQQWSDQPYESESAWNEKSLDEETWDKDPWDGGDSDAGGGDGFDFF